MNGTMSIRGTLNFRIVHVPKRLSRRRETWNVVERFRGHLINSTSFSTQAQAQSFVARELTRLMA